MAVMTNYAVSQFMLGFHDGLVLGSREAGVPEEILEESSEGGVTDYYMDGFKAGFLRGYDEVKALIDS